MPINGLPDITFTNNLGTIQFQMATMSIADTWTWNGRATKKSKSVVVEATVFRDDVLDAFDAMVTQPGGPVMVLGTLALPWRSISNIRLVSMDYPRDIWGEHLRVTVEFVDDAPDDAMYRLSWFGLPVHGPVLTLPVPHRGMRTDHIQMKFAAVEGVDPDQPAWGPIRTRPAFSRMAFAMTGHVRMEDVPGPTTNAADATMLEKMTHLAEVLSQRSQTSSLVGGQPAGWPRTFNLSEACPELADEIEISHMFVVSSQAVIDVESAVATITVQTSAPPQSYLK